MMVLQLHQWMQIYVICLHTLFLHLHYTETALNSHPEDTVAFVGQSVILKCSTTLEYPVDWLFERVGSSQTKTVYQGSSPNEVEAGHLIIRESSGQYDLKIRNVQIENAGTYTCVDESGVGEKQLAELTVIVSDPVCNSNMSLKEVIVKNDCDVEPDFLGLSCTVQHKSNIHPELMWRNVKTGEVHRDASKTEKINSTEYRITVKAVYEMNGTRYSCTVVGLSPSNIGTCQTQEIRIMYLFNSSVKVREVPADNFFMTCSANTSQECEYRWVDRSSFIEVRNRSIQDSIRLPPGNYQCIADCRFGDKTCTVMPALIQIVNKDPRSDIRNHAGENWTILMYFSGFSNVFLSIFIGIMCWRFRCFGLKRKVRDLETGRKTINPPEKKSKRRRILKPNVDDGTVAVYRPPEPNVFNVSKATVWVDYIQIKPYFAALVEFLDYDNGFDLQLLEQNIINFNQYRYLKARNPSSPGFNEEVLSLLIPILDGKEKTILTAFEETDQHHLAYILQSSMSKEGYTKENSLQLIMNDEVLKFFDACRRELTYRINPHCDFILLLKSSGCITKLHANKIMDISVDTEKTCKLLDILRKRSYAHLLTFISCLNVDQPEVMMVLQKKADSSIKRVIAQILVPFLRLTEETFNPVLLKAAVFYWKKFEKDSLQSIHGGYKGYAYAIKLFTRQFGQMLPKLPLIWNHMISKHNFRETLLRKIFWAQMKRCFRMIVERIDIRHELLELLQSVSEETIPSEGVQSIQTRATLINCLRNARVGTQLRFLRRLERTCQTHLLNYLAKSKECDIVGKDWPLDDNQRKRLIKHQEKFVQIIDPMKTSKPLGKDLLDILRADKCLSNRQKVDFLEDPKLLNRKLVQLLINGSKKAHISAIEYFESTDQEEVLRRFDFDYVAEDFVTETTFFKNNLLGITWLKGNVYAICSKTGEDSELVAFDPFANEDKQASTIIPDLKNPVGTAVHQATGSIYVIDKNIDKENSYIWKLKLTENDKEISNKKIVGQLCSLLIHEDKLLALVEISASGKFGWKLNSYKLPELEELSSFDLPDKIEKPCQMAQLSSGNFVISHKSQTGSHVSEISPSGEIVRALLQDLIEVNSPLFTAVAIDDKDNLFILDSHSGSIILLDYISLKYQIILAGNQHGIKFPDSICWVSDKQWLIVSQTGLNTTCSIFSFGNANTEANKMFYWL